MKEAALNPFAFYGIQESFHPDAIVVRATFIELSKKHHPDYFKYDTPEHAEALHYSSLNNEAWKVLSSFERRIEYLLTHHGLMRDGEKNVLPAAFLAEMLDLNDLIEEALGGDMPAREQAESLLESARKDVNERLDELTKLWDVSREHTLLADIHHEFQKLRYLQRLQYNFAEGVE
jgi:molecular chaperone HscB